MAKKAAEELTGRSDPGRRPPAIAPVPRCSPAGPTPPRQAAAPWRVGRRLAVAGGVEIADADLSRPMPSELKETILKAFRRHHIVVFPGQTLSREQQFAFAANFGEVETSKARDGGDKRHGVAHVISNLDADGNPVYRVSAVSNYNWHTDKSWRAVPPLLTTLYAVELPRQGGDTEFANTAMGYDALPGETQRRLAGLRVLFRWGARLAPADRARALMGSTETPDEVDHPLLRTHPDTGTKALYLGNHASHIRGMLRSEGTALLAALLDHTTRRRFVYVHRWRPGDLVMWDNRCLLHRAVANYAIERDRRILHRALVRGTVPF